MIEKLRRFKVKLNVYVKQKSMIKSKILFLLMMVSTLFTTTKVSAHGRVVSPASRAQQGVLAKTTMGYQAAHDYYGEVINNANQLETYEGFPSSPRSPNG
jgi:predicted carbohydrate-binding protein with CBM5 and CBM33 domain